jgi:hypothetical protein
MSGTPYQREVLAELKPRGFLPDGYDANGRLIIYHQPTGYRVHVPTKRDRNLLAQINRGVKKAESAAAQFERFIWEKHKIPPGTEKRCALSLSTEARDFMRQADIHGIRPQAIVTQVKRNGNFQNVTGKSSSNGHGPDHMEDEGPARRIWLISQPELPEVTAPWIHHEDPEPAPPPDATEAMALGVQEKIEEHQEPTPNALGIFDPELIDRLKHAFAGPIMLELRQEQEAKQLLIEELTRHTTELHQVMSTLSNLHAALLNVLEVVSS